MMSHGNWPCKHDAPQRGRYWSNRGQLRRQGSQRACDLPGVAKVERQVIRAALQISDHQSSSPRHRFVIDVGYLNLTGFHVLIFEGL